MTWKDEIKKEGNPRLLKEIWEAIDKINAYTREIPINDATKIMEMNKQIFTLFQNHYDDSGLEEPERAADWHLDNMGE